MFSVKASIMIYIFCITSQVASAHDFSWTNLHPREIGNSVVLSKLPARDFPKAYERLLHRGLDQKSSTTIGTNGLLRRNPVSILLTKRMMSRPQIQKEIAEMNEGALQYRIAATCGEFTNRGPHGAEGDPPLSCHLGRIADRAMDKAVDVHMNEILVREARVRSVVKQLNEERRFLDANRYQDAADEYSEAFNAYWNGLQNLHRIRREKGIPVDLGEGSESTSEPISKSAKRRARRRKGKGEVKGQN